MKFLVTLLLIGSLHAESLDCFGIPDWILPSILAVESHSTYLTNGKISVGDIRRGAAGELGCFQITRGAFRQVAKRGEYFGRLATDTAFAEVVAARYLHYLHKRHGSWVNAIQAYNAGRPCPAGRRYLNKIYAVKRQMEQPK